mgnify:CR=1 FL=1
MNIFGNKIFESFEKKSLTSNLYQNHLFLGYLKNSIFDFVCGKFY